MRGLRDDFYSLFMVLMVVMALVLVFPHDSFRFRALSHVIRPASAAFVTLTEREEAEALQAAKTAWQVNPSGFRHLRASLIVGELPECPHGSVAAKPVDMMSAAVEVLPFVPTAYPIERGAPPSRTLVAEPPAPRVLPFPKEELLKID